MKGLITIAYATFSAAVMSAAQIDGIIVRQQWPWSTDVKVDYMLSGVTSPVDVNVQFFDGSTAMTPTGSLLSLKGDLHGVATNGEKSFRFNPKELFGADMPTVSAFKVSLSLSDSDANVGETLYKIYDLDNGGCTDVTRADLLNGKFGTIETNYTAFTGFNTSVSDVLIWTGVTNDVKYATTHLVLRKIPAAGQTFKMGLPVGAQWPNGDETQHNVTMTNDFYMGVFEVTQYQYWKFTGNWPSRFSLVECRDTRPVDKGVSWEYIRGATSTVGGTWPTNLSHEVTSTSFLGSLRAALDGAPKIDLPTEAQWEYACRAKSTSDWYNGYECLYGTTTYESLELNKIARYRMSGGFGADGKIIANDAYAATLGTSNGTARVGSYLPNAWGLYDMTGNVAEWCLDWYAGFSSDDQTEPTGPDKAHSAKSTRSLRGGSIISSASNARTAIRASMAPSSRESDGNVGFRLCLTVAE